MTSVLTHEPDGIRRALWLTIEILDGAR